MDKRIIKAVKYLLAVFIVISFSQCGSNDDSPIEIKYAKRAKKMLSGSKDNPEIFLPANSKEDAILDVQIEGITLQEFEGIDPNSVYIKAGKRICPASYLLEHMAKDEETMRIIVVVPKDVLELTLYTGTYKPKTFEVDDEIYDELTEWKE